MMQNKAYRKYHKVIIKQRWREIKLPDALGLLVKIGLSSSKGFRLIKWNAMKISLVQWDNKDYSQKVRLAQDEAWAQVFSSIYFGPYFIKA